MSAPKKPSTRRTNEIGATLSDKERALVEQALTATGKKLATYIRDAVLETAKRDTAPAPRSSIDEEALADRIARILAARMGPGNPKKGEAEDSA